MLEPIGVGGWQAGMRQWLDALHIEFRELGHVLDDRRKLRAIALAVGRAWIESRKLRHAAEKVTSDCEQTIQRHLDELNAANSFHGAALLSEPHQADVLVSQVV